MTENGGKLYKISGGLPLSAVLRPNHWKCMHDGKQRFQVSEKAKVICICIHIHLWHCEKKLNCRKFNIQRAIRTDVLCIPLSRFRDRNSVIVMNWYRAV